MHRLTIVSLAAAMLLFSAVGSPVAAENETQPAPAAAAQAGDQAAPADENAAGCPAGGNCCGSAACTEAKRNSMKDGKAAMADCPCRRNRQKPDHAH